MQIPVWVLAVIECLCVTNQYCICITYIYPTPSTVQKTKGLKQERKTEMGGDVVKERGEAETGVEGKEGIRRIRNRRKEERSKSEKQGSGRGIEIWGRKGKGIKKGDKQEREGNGRGREKREGRRKQSKGVGKRHK